MKWRKMSLEMASLFVGFLVSLLKPNLLIKFAHPPGFSNLVIVLIIQALSVKITSDMSLSLAFACKSLPPLVKLFDIYPCYSHYQPWMHRDSPQA